MGTTAVRAPFSYFVDRTPRPTNANVREVLSQARKSWDDLVDHLAKSYQLKSSPHYMYGPRYGWALRFERSGRFMLALYPNYGRLTVQIILNIPQVDAAVEMRLPSFVLKVLNAAKKYPKERWLFIPVKTVRDAQGLRPLIALKVHGSKSGYARLSLRHEGGTQ